METQIKKCHWPNCNNNPAHAVRIDAYAEVGDNREILPAYRMIDEALGGGYERISVTIPACHQHRSFIALDVVSPIVGNTGELETLKGTELVDDLIRFQRALQESDNVSAVTGLTPLNPPPPTHTPPNGEPVPTEEQQ